jgi:hypothetical protein
VLPCRPLTASVTALAPQLRAVYRYGTAQDCKAKLDDFKHCLSLKKLDEEARRAAWIRHRAQRTAAMRLEGSSEDVWELRRDPLVAPALADPTIPGPADDAA